MKKVIFLFCLLFSVYSLSAQKINIDSLIRVAIAQGEAEPFKLYQNKDSLFRLLGQAKLPHQRIDLIYKILSYGQGLSKDGLNYHYKILSWATKNKDDISKAIISAELGFQTCFNGDVAEGISMGLNALQMAQKTKNNEAIAIAYDCLGYSYADDVQGGNTSSNSASMNCFKLGLKFAKLGHNDIFIAYNYGGMGSVFNDTHKTDSAIFYTQRSFEHAVIHNFPIQAANSLLNLGDEEKDGKLKLKYYRAGAEIAAHSYATNALSYAYVNLGRFYKDHGQVDSAMFYANKAYNFTNNEAISTKIDPALLLDQLYSHEKLNADSALKYTNIYHAAKDSMFSIGKAVRAQAVVYAGQQRQQEIEAQKTAFQTRLRFYVLSVAIVFLVLLAIVFWRNNKKSKHANILLKKQKEEIDVQARESQIELALERVRARTMAMQQSDELSDTAAVLFQQFSDLGTRLIQVTIGVFNEEEHVLEMRVTDFRGGGAPMATARRASLDEPTLINKAYKAWKENKKSMVVDLQGDDLRNWIAYRDKMVGIKDESPLAQRRVLSYAFFSKGEISISSAEPLPTETIRLLERFSIVFDGTYTRFLDLQKAEAQAREAKLEAALEKVRSRSLEMHKTAELGDVVNVLFEKMKELSVEIDSDTASIMIFEEGSRDFMQWISDPQKVYAQSFKITYIDHPIPREFFKARENGSAFFSKAYGFKEKNEYWKQVFEESDFKHLPEDVKNAVLGGEGYALSVAMSKNSGICIPSFQGKLLSESGNEILKRFARVFEQCYIRFLDLQKAEAQAMEAQIESALERVRSRTMAMQNSDEFADTAEVVFKQLIGLGIEPNRLFIGIIPEDNGEMELWATNEDGSKLGDRFTGHKSGNPSIARMYEGWQKQERSITIDMQGIVLEDYFNYLKNQLNVPFKLGPAPKHRVQNIAYFSKGFIGMASPDEQPPETINLLERFAGVFNLTIVRFHDLKQAEAQAREAQIELGLERVRARAMAMQSSNELADLVSTVLGELKKLDFALSWCLITIVDYEAWSCKVWMANTNVDQLPQSYHLPFIHLPFQDAIMQAWKERKTKWVYELKGDEKLATDDYMFTKTEYSKLPQVVQDNIRSLNPAFFSFSFSNFGGLQTGGAQPLSEANLEILSRFGKVFDLTYTRFNDLKLAEALAEQAKQDLVKLQKEKKRAETALSELKATQTQLIQSEKMASLGELTAGIAHEIQNPLNFVNNFSEVSVELLQELKEEAEAGHTADVIAITADLTQNLEKINHHGKRADFIVKGMLQHSRTSTGEKQLTNINTLSDEFLKLSYHGLRAKDKAFNCELVTNFEESLPKVNVAQQDIGRVLLNLFNNAFYAVKEKQKTAGPEYKPTIEVSSAMSEKSIKIIVNDNGNGIPDAIKDKIMQPFFTTKPTGEGTGLGLSLSYDIVVKGHGGKIDVKSTKDEGSEFIITLPII